MSDYIDILLTALEDELFPSLGKDYFLSLQQANDALTALSATLTDQQRALLDSYDGRLRRRRQRLSGRLRPQGLPPRAGGLPLNGLAVQRPGVAAGDGHIRELPDQGLVPFQPHQTVALRPGGQGVLRVVALAVHQHPHRFAHIGGVELGGHIVLDLQEPVKPLLLLRPGGRVRHGRGLGAGGGGR